MSRNRPRRRQVPQQDTLAPPAPGSHLGDFGQARPAPNFTFGWLGQRFRVHPNASTLRELDFIEKAMTMNENDPRAAVFVKDNLRNIVHPDDFDRFWSTALENHQEIPDLIGVQQHVLEAMLGRPTGLPGASSPGQTSTEANSTEDSSSPDTVPRRLDGRPDLQLAVWQADLAQQTG